MDLLFSENAECQLDRIIVNILLCKLSENPAIFTIGKPGFSPLGVGLEVTLDSTACFSTLNHLD